MECSDLRSLSGSGADPQSSGKSACFTYSHAPMQNPRLTDLVMEEKTPVSLSVKQMSAKLRMDQAKVQSRGKAAGEPPKPAAPQPAAASVPVPAPAPVQAAPPPRQEQSELRKRAVNLFTFLRELVSLRTTVTRSCDSYDRALWIDQVPREAECDCVAFRPAKEDDPDESWLQVRKPTFSDPPVLPPELIDWVNEDQLRNSTLDAPRLLDEIDVAHAPAPQGQGQDEAAASQVAAIVHSADHPQLRAEWERYVAEKWRPWAEEDRRKRRVLRVYTELFSLYQQQKELGEAYEVVLAVGQLRWAPRPGVEVNRHLVAVQTSIEFDTQRGVITVGPAAEGAKPRLEEDMLELDERPAPDVLSALEQQVAQCDDDIWHNEQMVGALKSFVHSLGNGEGSFSDDLAPLDRPTAVPQVRWAPAVIVRRRTEQGLLHIYGKILEDLKKRPEVPPGLTPLVEIGWQERKQSGETAAPDTGGSDSAATPANLLFPLPFNDEQREIVERFQLQSGVVVQGPPGTGKSHTIANLVCHLLATGNRVLVTSHAPRALRILKDKIPQAITNMCVVLLGNDRTAMTELEASVQVITQQLNHWNPRERAAAIKELEEQLTTLQNRAAEVDKNLRAARQSDTQKHPPLPGGYAGSLQNIAQALRTQQNQHGWIAQFAQGMEADKLPDDPGVSNQEAVELVQGLRSLDAERRKDLRRELPPATEAISPDDLEKMIAEEKQAAAVAEAARAAVSPDAPALLPPDLEADESTLRELSELLERIVQQNSEMEAHRLNWVPRLARDIRSGEYEPWRLLLEQTQAKLAAIRRHPEQVFELEVIGTGDIDIATVRDDVELLYNHVKGGGKLKKLFRWVSPAKERMYIFQDVRIGGKRIKGMDTFKQLRAWTDVQSHLQALAKLWSDISEPPIGAVMRRLPIWLERCGIIGQAQQMQALMERAKEVVRRLNLPRPPAWHNAEQLSLMQRQLKVLLVHKEYAAKRGAVESLAELAASRASSSTAHPITRAIADALRRRDTQAYRAAHAQIKELWAEREKVARSEELLKKLTERLPKCARAISDDPSDLAWDERLARINESWLWLKADRWLKQQLDPKHFEYLQSERKGLQEHLQAAMVKLAAEKAWYHCMTRMTPAEETYLKAWMQAIRNIGAGTGKRANRFRKVARQTLDRCRSAIPAWIMPIHRVAETVSPGEDLFDVVIVDEASQSGAEALFLHYIAKKIIIVGDDKQIAPYNVGINRDDVELLRTRHIPDLPLSDYFDLDHSFFDQAFLRFGNRIRLCEHFRCMPEIIQFSNNLCYSNEPLLPLRQFGDGRLEPVVVARHVPSAHMEGTSPNVVNRMEAEAIAKQISKLVADPAYKDKTMGVISLLGEKQARLIEDKLLATVGPEEMERRRLVCGDAYSFQGDERHVMFLSLVAAADEGRRLATLTQAADERRFNVAASRARDQMWLFHSLTPDDISAKCLRRQLLEYCLKPEVPQESGDELPLSELETAAANADRTRVPPPPPFESWLELDIYLQVRRRGYRVLPQYSFAGYKIDLVINGSQGRLAVECDGEEWPGQDRYETDMARQRQLERCGWRFWRIRGGAFYRNPDAALQSLWELLEKHGIRSRNESERPAPAPRSTKIEPQKFEPETRKPEPAKRKDIEPVEEPAPVATPTKRAAAKKRGKAA